MRISETYVNADHGSIYGAIEPYEPWTDNRRRLFRALQRDYGRCISRVYVDRRDGTTQAIGWVFQARVPYETRPWARPETYLREVWVVVHED